LDRPRVIRTCEVLLAAGADPKLASSAGDSPETIAAHWTGLGIPVYEQLAGRPKAKKKRG
jgi:hypothetical protein